MRPFVVLSLLWGWWIDGRAPDRADLAGAALCAIGTLSAVTTTSGLAWKIPGRVGDSPIIPERKSGWR